MSGKNKTCDTCKYDGSKNFDDFMNRCSQCFRGNGIKVIATYDYWDGDYYEPAEGENNGPS